VIALLRLFSYTNDSSHRAKAEQTLEVFAGSASKFGMFAATYGLAVTHFTHPHTQVIVIGHDELANQLSHAALAPLDLNKAVLRMHDSDAVPQNLPPALAETVPNLPALHEGKSFAVVCSRFTCQPPVFDAAQLEQMLKSVSRPAA